MFALPLQAIWGLAKGFAVGAFDFLWGVLHTRLGQLAAVALVFFVLGGWHKENVLTSNFEARVQRERAARDYAIKQAAAQAKSDADQLDETEARLKQTEKEIHDAARANYRKPGLDVGSVRRLSKIR